MSRRVVLVLVGLLVTSSAPVVASAQDPGWVADFDWRAYGLARFGTEDAETRKVILSSMGDQPGLSPAPWGHPLRTEWRLRLFPDPLVPPGTTMNWDIKGVGSFATAVAGGSDGSLDVVFPELGAYSATLTAHLPDGTTSLATKTLTDPLIPKFMG